MLVVRLELVELFFFFDCWCVLAKSPLACFINFSCLLTNTERGSANELEVLQDVGVGEHAAIAAVAGAGFHHDRDAIVRELVYGARSRLSNTAIIQFRRRKKKSADDKRESSFNFCRRRRA